MVSAFHASTVCLSGAYHLVPPLVTGGRVGHIATHPDARRFLLVCASLDLAHRFASNFLSGPYAVYEVLVDGPGAENSPVWCAPFARIVRQVHPNPVVSPLRYQRALRIAARQAASPLAAGKTLLATSSLDRYPAHLPGMNENTTAAHIALAPADMNRITAKTRRPGFVPAARAQSALFDIATRSVTCPLRSVTAAQRVGSIISAARSGFYPGVLVG